MTTRLQLGAALVRSDILRGPPAKHGQPDLNTATSEKATPAVRNRTAGVAQGEEIRADPRGKSYTALLARWRSQRHLTDPGTSGIPASLTEDLEIGLPDTDTIELHARFHYRCSALFAALVAAGIGSRLSLSQRVDLQRVRPASSIRSERVDPRPRWSGPA